MQSLNPLRGGPTQPPTIESDEIFKLHFMDNQMSPREIVLSQALLFSSVLDATKLHDGLVKLVSSGDWRKLGGRLRKQRDGLLELHVPTEFTAERPAVLFRAETMDMPIGQHPLAARLARAATVAAEGGGPSLHPGTTEFKELSLVPGWCTKQDDYLSCDDPVLGLRVILFADATIVSLTIPHVVVGALGFQSIFLAWSAALRDDGVAIPPLLGAQHDFFDSIDEEDEGGRRQSLISSCRRK
ncbi:hypothetical protein PG988_001372 [Apiospora saccharicola]